MANEWLSESISDGAKSVILLGSLSNDLLFEHSKIFPLGILWFAPVDTKEIHLPKNVKLVKINKGFNL